MANMRIQPAKKFSGCPRIPGDKSISHRALILGAIAKGRTEIENLLESGDVQSSARILSQLGVKISKRDGKTFVDNRGAAFSQPSTCLDCGNSGTTMRVMMGVLSGAPGLCVEMTGDSSLRGRPMRRVAEPLSLMGAQCVLTGNEFAPVTIVGNQLKVIDYELKIASAQIKTAIMLAAMSAEGTTRIHGEVHSRDHTERLLTHFGVKLERRAREILIPGAQELSATKIKVPGDPSAAAFWVAGALLIPGGFVELKNISLNPTRTGFLRVLERMGAKIETIMTETNPEPMGDINLRYDQLCGVGVDPSEVASLIDELPMLAVLASQAHGVTRVRGAQELRVKETDRIQAVAQNLRAMGGEIETTPDGFVVEGPQKLRGAQIESFGDHRIAMAFSVAAQVADADCLIVGAECAGISYPKFFSTLAELTS